MRRLSVALALITLALPGCRIKKKSPEAKQTVAAAPVEDGQLTSVANAGDPLRTVQFVRGFYGIENQSWRWTAKNFAVTLRSLKASQGAMLEMKFVIPEVMFNRVGAMTVDAKANGLDLGPETFSTAGDATYTREVPAIVLAGDSTTFEFSVDKGLPPSVKDPRELALIVSSVGLVPKAPK
jgi:hypothetical protein